MRSTAELAANTLTAALVAVLVSWWLGLEQVIPGLILLCGAWRLWRRRGIEGAPEAWIFALLVGWSLTSMPALEGSTEWLLYGRGEAHLVVGLAAYMVAAAVDPASAAYHRFLKAGLIFVGATGVLSVLVATEVLPLAFRSPIAVLWPSLEGWSKFADGFLLRRQMATPYGVSLIPEVKRQSLFFLYQGGLATALLILGGWMMIARRRFEGAWRYAATGAVTACLGLVIFTGSRTGILMAWGVAASLAFWNALAGRSWRRWAVRIVVLAVLLGGVVAVIPRGDGTLLSHGALWEKVLIDFRVNSFLDRLAIYTETFERLAERPWTGWGIQGRPEEGGRYLRLGTHSELLNVAYRFGWVGFGLLLAGGLAYLRRFHRRTRGRDEQPILVLVLLALAATGLFRTFQWDLNVFWLVMVFFGTSVARTASTEPREGELSEVSMLGARLHPRTMDALHGEIARAVQEARSLVIGHQNLHGLYLLDREPAMRSFAQRADLVFFDGMAVVGLARCLGYPVERRHRVTYADWLDPLATECARRGWRVFHLGGRPGVGEQARAALEARHPGLEMATLPGYFDAVEEEAILATIAAFDPQLVMVGMGMPRQEAWVVRNADKIGPRVILTCGACMDYAAGVVATPPRWAGRLGLEWLFRLLREPRRLFRRYLLEPWAVLWRFAGEWWRVDRDLRG